MTSLVFLAPLLYAVYASLRPYAETAEYGYFSLPHKLTFDNYAQAWQQSRVLHFLVNTLIIVVPSLVLILLLSSFVAFAAGPVRRARRQVRC